MTSGFFANHKVNHFHFSVHNFLIVFNILLNTAQMRKMIFPHCAKIDTAKMTSLKDNSQKGTQIQIQFLDTV